MHCTAMFFNLPNYTDLQCTVLLCTVVQYNALDFITLPCNVTNCPPQDMMSEVARKSQVSVDVTKLQVDKLHSTEVQCPAL